MSRLLLVRHGETRFNSHERFWGKTDVELGEAGLRQAEQLRDRLALEKISAIYCSGLKRAMVTAETIASRHPIKPEVCPELDEVDFGRFEGLTFAEISKRYPEVAEQLSAWSISPGFPEGETMDQVNARVAKFLPRLKKHQPEETVLIVAHAGTLRLLVCDLLEIEVKRWRQFRLNLASLSIIETFPRGAVLTLLNDVSHLK